ncbi:tyrosine-type recombinase/integrase [Vibrio splendidus]|uniref:tyrosine-type recombinase/integrase n=1 Tax=Vibrio splendidus TaxID=29497 RepID=UPI00352F5FAA
MQSRDAIRMVKTEVRFGIPAEASLQDSSLAIDIRRRASIYAIVGIRNQGLSNAVNTFIMYKAAKCVDTSSISKALHTWCIWLDETGINAFTPAILHYKSPTYGFKEELLIRVNENKCLSYTTASSYINTIKSFYQFLIDNDVVPPNIFFKNTISYSGRRYIHSTDLTIRLVKKHQSSSLNPLNQQKCVCVLEVIRGMDTRNYLMFMLMLGCGLRGQEVCTMNSKLFKADIFANNESFLISGLEIGPRVGISTKFSRHRDLFITKPLYEEALDYVESEDYESHVTKYNKKYETNESYIPLFLTSAGEPISKSVLYNTWGQVKKEVISRFNIALKHKPHDLRATFGTNLLRLLTQEIDDVSGSLEVVMTAMGHKSESQTLKYVKYLSHSNMMDKAADILDRAAVKFYTGIP